MQNHVTQEACQHLRWSQDPYYVPHPKLPSGAWERRRCARSQPAATGGELHMNRCSSGCIASYHHRSASRSRTASLSPGPLSRCLCPKVDQGRQSKIARSGPAFSRLLVVDPHALLPNIPAYMAAVLEPQHNWQNSQRNEKVVRQLQTGCTTERRPVFPA
ncbi:hypothetical protein BDV96DRAFT_272670 [Lophiotrema nucula]|uniref:Uncharacterized protein n=1 Tax=Lophiotrema nucula TaxID=690887 RepID=A0A6A5ZPB2_9PLEO|nr:hypothetical protein BDV96DRAFT_272670 [Lophiotrema nucula]